MQKQIADTRKGSGKKLEKVNWQEFYAAVKKFL
jgi:hypothetical protein